MRRGMAVYLGIVFGIVFGLLISVADLFGQEVPNPEGELVVDQLEYYTTQSGNDRVRLHVSTNAACPRWHYSGSYLASGRTRNQPSYSWTAARPASRVVTRYAAVHCAEGGDLSADSLMVEYVVQPSDTPESPPDLPPEPADCSACEAERDSLQAVIDSLTAPEPPPPPPDEGTLELLVSASPDRSAPQPVAGSLLHGEVYIFAVVGGRAADSVVFQIDAEIEHVELTAPYDLAGGGGLKAAPYNTKQLENGSHSFAAIAWNGNDQWGVVANGIVSNPDSVAVIPDSVLIRWAIDTTGVQPPADTTWWIQHLEDPALTLPGNKYVYTALLYFEGLPYICMDDSELWEAKPAADESRACGVSDGLRHSSCTNPRAHLSIASDEECPSLWAPGNVGEISFRELP